MKTFDPSWFKQLDQLVIRHSAFRTATAAIASAIRDADRFTDKSLLPLIGPSRSGKSRLIEVYLSAGGCDQTVLYMVMPRSRRPKAMLMKLLQALGDQFYSIGTEDQMLMRALMMLKKRRIRVLIVDEFQHGVSPNGQINYEVADIFKVLLDDAKVAIVAAGLESCHAVLEANEQLTGRCLQSVHIPRFDWTQPKARAEFAKIVHAYSTCIQGVTIPFVEGEEFAFRWYVATGGLVGFIHKVARRLLSQLADADRTVATIDDLCKAHAAAIYYRGPQVRPFDPAFSLSNKVAGLAHAARIGERRDPQEDKVPGPKRSHILSTTS